ncbi:MAG TPA: protein kinase, partial [Thermoanaerobaculia bacterium]
MSDLQRITERYLFDRLIGSSASGSVFRAVDNRSGRTVAVKLLTSLPDEAGRERFLAVARALQRLDHPSVPTVLEAGFTAGGAFLVTDYLPGSRLDASPDGPAPRLLALLLGVVDGLEAMAAAGVAHGNLRADNLLVTPETEGEDGRERVKILGLGGAAGPWSEESGRVDLYGLATLACRLLGAMFAPDSDRPPV